VQEKAGRRRQKFGFWHAEKIKCRQAQGRCNQRDARNQSFWQTGRSMQVGRYVDICMHDNAGRKPDAANRQAQVNRQASEGRANRW